MPFGNTTFGGEGGAGGASATQDNSTVLTLIEATLRHLNGMHRAEWNKLELEATSTTDTLTFTYTPKGITSGSYVAIDDEILYVWETAAAAKTATVQRAMLGSTRTAHDAGELVEINPRFPRFAIREALRSEIRSWTPNLFRVQAGTFTVPAWEYNIDLDGVTGLLHVLDVEQVPTTTGPYTRVPYRTARNSDTGVFESEFVARLSHCPGTDTDYRVVYASSFDTLDMSDDTYLIEDIGLTESLFDIAPLGAAWRLLASREVKRTFTEGQGEPRIAQEVPPGHILQTAAGLKQLRDQRISEESKRLAMAYSPKVLQ